ncbi:MAG TPA: DUF2953 domain-containing protein [Pseudobacteroides sp.]|uniref:DUF2953 domain-containing protein n=1 Tax=Pseudobacteroides sp. TaxID=1968840 RepID=UPI002F91D997
MVILFILKVFGILLSFVVLLLLFVPFTYCVAARKHKDTHIKAGVSWLFGLLGFTFSKKNWNKSQLYIRLLKIKFSVINSNTKKLHLKVDSKYQKKDKLPQNNVRFLDKNFLKPIMKALKELFYHIKPKRFKLEGRYGFEDPFYTGVALASFNIMRPLFINYNVNVCPVFEDEILEGNFLIKGRLILIAVMVIAIKTLFNKNVRKILFSKEEKAYVN